MRAKEVDDEAATEASSPVDAPSGPLILTSGGPARTSVGGPARELIRAPRAREGDLELLSAMTSEEGDEESGASQSRVLSSASERERRVFLVASSGIPVLDDIEPRRAVVASGVRLRGATRVEAISGSGVLARVAACVRGGFESLVDDAFKKLELRSGAAATAADEEEEEVDVAWNVRVEMSDSSSPLVLTAIGAAPPVEENRGTADGGRVGTKPTGTCPVGAKKDAEDEPKGGCASRAM
jgi:hypothetical protein